MSITLLALAMSLFFAPSDTRAQTNFGALDGILPSGLSISLVPENPQPGESVILTLSGHSGIDRSYITWVINGSPAVQGIGEKKIRLVAGKLGSVMVIEAEAEIDGRMERVSTTVRPTSLSIIAEASGSYAPPLYRGKALPAVNSSIRLLAVPEFVDENGNRHDPATLVYTWKGNSGRVIAQGYGRRVLDTQMPRLFTALDVSVEAETTDQTLKSRAFFTIAPQKPLVLVYEDHPLFGLRFDRALGNSFSLSGAEITLSAFPFWMSALSRDDPNLSYAWNIVSGESRIHEQSASLTLRPEAGGQGIADVSLAVSHSQQFLQGADTKFRFTFDAR